MTQNDMLRLEVARRLAAGGHAHDNSAVDAFLAEIRQDVAALLAQAAASMRGCTTPHGECRCRAAEIVYDAMAGAVERGEAA